MKLLILADDFTGAMDTGVQLSKNRIKTLVFAKIPVAILQSEKPEKTSETHPECEVLVINTNLRHESAKDAYATIAKILMFYREPGLHFYLKTDSALRGNISATFAAAIQTLKLPLHFLPAFPDAKRTAEDGILYIEGTVLEESVFRNDPRSPMTESHIEKIINRDYTLPIGTQMFFYDGKTNEDLEKIGLFLKEKNELTLTAGCAGFAKQLPSLIPFETEADYIPNTPGPILVLSGSANAITFKQLAQAKKDGYPLLLLKEYMEAAILNPQKSEEIENQLVEKAVSLLNEKTSVILATATSKESLLNMDELKKTAGSYEAVHESISACTARLARRILNAARISCLTVFGGDTVAGILDELDCNRVIAKGEVATGVPLCLLTDRNLHLITKSGGLGCEEIVNTIDKYFNSL